MLATALVAAAGLASALGAMPRSSDEHETLKRFCSDCHSGAEPKGGFELSDLEFVEGPELWWSVSARIEDHSMPPPKATPLGADKRAELLAWIETLHPHPILDWADLPSPPVRRYNRFELLNILEELFGVRVDRDRLMPDEIGDGFDTHAGTLTWSELGLEKWVELVEEIVHNSVRPRDGFEFARRVVPRDDWKTRGGSVHVREWRVALYTSGSVAQTLDVPVGGAYRIEVETNGTRGGDELPRLELRSGNRLLAEFDVEAVGDWEVAKHVVELRAGRFPLKLVFPNDFSAGGKDRNLFVREVALVGPLGEPVLSQFQSRFVGTDAKSARAVIERFLALVWRRPVEARDVRELLALTKSSDELELRVRTALIAALVSPRFHTLGLGAGESPQYALADRLSALVWKSAPDAELLAHAAKQGLDQPAVLRAELRRMLDGVQASEFAADFAAQWLQLRALDDFVPDAQLFPDFDAELSHAMQRESELFFEAILRENRPVRDLLLADFSFVNERLAKHYGQSLTAASPEFRRVRLPRDQRAGVLGQAAVLTVTSNPTRTSPVLRGKWILEAILDTPPAPPPPDAANLASVKPGTSAASMRERLELHREDSECAACHAALDPLGFALENFDATGAWRTHEAGLPVDTQGVLPDGRSFESVRELAQVLSQGDAFLRAFTQRLSTYALGRSLLPVDDLWLDPLVTGWDPERVTVADVLEGIVTSPAFNPQLSVDPGADPQR